MRKLILSLVCSLAAAQTPKPIPGGYDLPNGWRITPVGKVISTEDMLLNVVAAPDGKAMIALHSGFNPHGLVVIDPVKEQAAQRIGLKSSFLGLAWHPDGSKLYVSGGNATGRKPTKAPVYVFGYANGKLTDSPVAELHDEETPMDRIHWSGLVHHPSNGKLYAANKGTANEAGYLAVFDSASGKLTGRIKVAINPYDVVLSDDGRTLFVSNWASGSVSMIDTESSKTLGTISVGSNPNDLQLHSDDRLFVSCANDNSVVVIDTKQRKATERISVALTPFSPEGSTPNALTLDRRSNILFVANADNNAIAVVQIAVPGKSEVLGFIPAGWYPSSLALRGTKLYIGNSKGMGSYSNERGPHSRLPDGPQGKGSVKSLQKGSVNILDIANLKSQIKKYTEQVYANVPYKDEYLTKAKPPREPSIVPQQVGANSPIEHIIYIIKENRTYDQVFGDIPKGNGDPRITIFGRKITPNQHALAEQFVLFDNLYCDGEVSVDGHSWSNSAYATDFNEKYWPPNYGGHSRSGVSLANVPKGGHMWDLAKTKGLTFRSYGEYATRSSDGTAMEATPNAVALFGHVSAKFKLPGMRDTDNVRVFIEEFNEYERSFDSRDPNKRLPNFIVMSLPENHTAGTRPGAYTPRAMVANNDLAVGQLVERVTRSRYWAKTAIFVIEDDAQDGSDHVDARRTVGLAISPYIKRGSLDSTLYTTSSMLRTMQLLLGLPPMSQYDAAAMPMYAAFGMTPDLTAYQHLPAEYDLKEKNLETAWGARKSLEMNLDEIDQAPMFAFNEIIWKSVKGADSEMPLPVHRFHFPNRGGSARKGK